MVTQGEETRRYEYDSMGRMRSATTPEANNHAVTYAYTNFGALHTRTDPRGVVTTYDYDPLHRPWHINYDVGSSGVPATPTVTFSYGSDPAQNNKNRLLEVSDGTNSDTYHYDTMGRVTRIDKVVDGTPYPIQYGYNLAGELQSITYPSGRVVSNSFDPIGRLTTVASGGINYMRADQSYGEYNAAGLLKKFTYGNGVVAQFDYNDRLQLSSIRYVNGATDLLNLGYNYGPTNNGQIHDIKFYTSPGVEDPSKSMNFTYDEWSRLKIAGTTNLSVADTWQLQWSYDRFGNRLTQSLTGGTASVTQPQLQISKTTNQITSAGFSYLENGVNGGNLTNDGLHSYTYDAENRIVQVDGGASAYAYDGNGLRVKSVVGSTTTRYIYSGTQVIAEYVNGSLSREYVYAGGQVLATLTDPQPSTSGAPIYHHRDHLSTRVETDSTATVTRTFGHLPFGDTWYETGTGSKWKFTTYERDSSGLDYAINRSHSSRLGRFMCPDLLTGALQDPQSLNHYAYVRNDPVSRVDPLGLCDFRIGLNSRKVITSKR